MPRRKFLRYYGPLQLRVEQIGPDLWGGSVYLGFAERTSLDGSTDRAHVWDPFTDLTEEAAKRDAIATASFHLGSVPNSGDSDWRDLSDCPDADWERTLNRQGFPGYPDRPGIQRWTVTA